MKKALHIAIFVLFFLLMFIDASAGYEKYLSRETSPRVKFHAQQIVRKLSGENIKKLSFIEKISRNFKYDEFKKLKKNFWKARMHVVRGNIIAARYILEKNKKNIQKLLGKIANDYQKRSRGIVNASAHSLSSLKMMSMEKNSRKVNEKLTVNSQRMKVAVNRLNTAFRHFHHEKYIQAIIQYRNAKAVAIIILEDLANPKERIIIKQRYKLDLADNRNNKHGVYVE